MESEFPLQARISIPSVVDHPEPTPPPPPFQTLLGLVFPRLSWPSGDALAPLTPWAHTPCWRLGSLRRQRPRSE